jgi:alginate O-acetyltransferase complex protein AlgI
MTFTDVAFAMFLPLVFALYWAVRNKTAQNLVLLVASYVFYGFVHPWFCVLLGASTVVDYGVALLMDRPGLSPRVRKGVLGVSVAANLGLLGVFKYFDFFAASVGEFLGTIGLHVEPLLLNIMLPVGISFYTFQTLSYTVDVYRGDVRARKNFIDFALFVSCFPQLVAGPIERATTFLPQIETPRRWRWDMFFSAIPLIVLGFFKKLMVADNLAGLVNQVYMLQEPSAFVLFAGTVGFAIQIFADFSAYTDIARGSARLLGFELMENFNAPYLAVSPSDFWRRWHISLSTWIRDYLYIPLGGSRAGSPARHALVLIVTFGLSGLWHGAQWHFVIWGLYYALLLIVYQQLGMSGKWKPEGILRIAASWSVMMLLTLVGWTLFRAGSVGWLANAAVHGRLGLTGDDLFAGSLVLGYCIVYSSPWVLYHLMKRYASHLYWPQVVYHWVLLTLILLLANRDPQAFIYFQF